MAENKQELKIELSPEIATGHYSNLAVISHGPNEFFLDFIAVAPNMPQAKVVSRIIMSPENAKNLAGVLAENIRRYEATFGPINQNTPKTPQSNGGIPNPFSA